VVDALSVGVVVVEKKDIEDGYDCVLANSVIVTHFFGMPVGSKLNRHMLG